MTDTTAERPGIDRRTLLGAVAATAAGAAATAGFVPRSPADAAVGVGVQSCARPARVQTGVERLIARGYDVVRGQKMGIVTNQTGVLPDLKHAVDVMTADGRVDLVAVFAPEHGFRGTARAGTEGYYVDRRTGLPVFETYGTSRAALADVLRRSGVDTVVFDIQDVGARFYTYIWTLYDTMLAAAVTDKRFVVLDRPNPTTGLRPRGPVLDPAFASFVGRREICQQHAMTVGELARLYAAEFLPNETARPVRLEVVPMRGWHRKMLYVDTGLPWVMPSANMPTPDTALVYSGTGLLEGTNVSEGRGTTRPFELVGAPYLDERWMSALRAERLPGVLLREAAFVPTTSKWVGTTCNGAQLHVTDPRTFDPLRTAVAMLVHAKRLYGPFAWRGNSSIDRLSGSARLRTMVDAGADVDGIVKAWQAELADFDRKRDAYLIYE